MRIFVNGRRIDLEVAVVTYDSAARLAFPSLGAVPAGLAVTYMGRDGRSGSLSKGELVTAEEDDSFLVTS